jgi:hypothetical protein
VSQPSRRVMPDSLCLRLTSIPKSELR